MTDGGFESHQPPLWVSLQMGMFRVSRSVARALLGAPSGREVRAGEPVTTLRASTVVMLLAGCLLVWVLGAPDTAAAKYDPAPSSLVAAAQRPDAPPLGSVARRAWIVCHVWGGPRYRCRRVLNVAWCESGLRPWARNGQYRGIFQMSAYNRGKYGHDPRSVWVQARAAKALWNDRHWDPWECRPWR